MIVLQIIYQIIVGQAGMMCLFERLCTMEMRLDTVEAFAEHGVFCQGSSEWFVQRNESRYIIPAVEIPYKPSHIILTVEIPSTNFEKNKWSKMHFISVTW